MSPLSSPRITRGPRADKRQKSGKKASLKNRDINRSSLVGRQTDTTTIDRDTMARTFYEDEESVTPLPGTTIAASESELKALGPNTIINGTSIRSPSFIQSKIESARGQINSAYDQTTKSLDDVTAAYHAKEEHFTTTLANLHNKSEDVLSSAQYIAVAGLFGLIVTRRSNVLLKTVTPLVLSLCAFKLFMPGTWNNTLGFAHDIEKKKFPQLAVKQENLINHTNSLISDTETKTIDVQKSVESQWKALADSFKKLTGLRIGEDATKK